jgi:DNA-binding transcriptional regulator YhcF (GntR family)
MIQDIINIDVQLATPKYEQIYNSVLQSIRSGKLTKGDKIPSINDICNEFQLARETVVKSFNKLKSEGLVESVHGKGFYINSTNIEAKHNVFLLFDSLSAYKEVMYHAIKEAFGKNAVLDIYFHHFNIKMFENIVKEHVGGYTSYIVVPFEHKRINAVLNLFPPHDLFVLDRYPKEFRGDYVGVVQDFDNDVYTALLSTGDAMKKYKKLTLVFRNIITDPPEELIAGIKRFCTDHQKECEILYDPPEKHLKKGESYIVIDDDDLVNLVLYANEANLKMGEDVGIISYNETPLKRVVGNGISVISTDFSAMGKRVVQMIKNHESRKIINPCYFIDRGSF